MAMTDPAWEGAGKVAGMELWRIENKCPVKLDAAEVNGTFYRFGLALCVSLWLLA
jgi:hypothetical protein